MAKKTIFISYDYDNDKHWKNLLVAWDKNGEFDFTFYDASVDVSVDSTDAAAIKRVISRHISGGDAFPLYRRQAHTQERLGEVGD